MEAVIESEGAVSNGGPSIYDLLITSIDENEKERQEYQREQDELRERVDEARGWIRQIDSGRQGEVVGPSQARVRVARTTFWDRLAELTASPSVESLRQARLALRSWRLAKLTTISSVVTEVFTEPIETYEVVPAEPLKTCLENIKTEYVQQNRIGVRYSRRKYKRAEALRRRHAIEVAMVRSRGSLEALEDANDGLYGALQKSFDIVLTDEEYNKAVQDFQKPPRKMNPKYFSRTQSEAEADLTFASRKVKAVKQKQDDNKKKKKGGKKRTA